MWKINGYVLPANDYKGLNEDGILDFGAFVDELKKTESVWLLDEFYDLEDSKEITASDFLYGKETTDHSIYLLEIIDKGGVKKNNSYPSYSALIEEEKEGTALMVIDQYPPIKEPNSKDTIMESIHDLIEAKRYYLSLCSSYEELRKLLPYVFRNLIFLDDFIHEIDKMGKYSEYKEEIIKHLYVLNQYADKKYRECNNEVETLRFLQSGHGILCSSKGSGPKDKSLNFHKDIEHKGKKIRITCNLHTKLLRPHSNARIYFSWGRKEIDESKVIIAHIGRHWSNADSKREAKVISVQ